MKAAYVMEPGSLENLIYGEQPEPKIEPNEVLVRVRACALNHLDVFSREGSHGTRITPPFIPGRDIAGEVAEVGSRVSRLKVGDRVVFVGGRGYAEYAKAVAEYVYTIPDFMSFEEAAAVASATQTSWHAIITRAGLRVGDDCLIVAAAGGVGSHAIQVAKLAGARVIATAGADWKLEKCKEIGADFVINHAAGDFSGKVREITDGRGVDVVYDTVGADHWKASFASLAKGGRFVTSGVTAGHKVELHLGQVFSQGLIIMGPDRAGGGSIGPDYPEMPAIMRLAHSGALKGFVWKTFPLSEAAAAQQCMEGREFFGRLVITP